MERKILKEWLLKNTIRTDSFYNNRCSSVSWWNKHPDEYQNLLEETSFFNDSVGIKERVYAILDDTFSIPVCKGCGKPVKLHKREYSQYCSLTCGANNKETQEKRKKTTKEKYGVDYISQSPIIQEIIEKNCQEKYNRNSANNLHISNASMKLLNTKRWLQKMHIVRKKDLQEITEYLNKYNKDDIYYGTVRDYLDKHGIPFQINKTGTSRQERELEQFLIDNNIKHIMHYRPRKDMEADLFVPASNFAIEFNGLYTHGYDRPETSKEKNRHLAKCNFYKDLGITLIQIFENEWEDRKEIWKSIILNKLGKCKRIMARKCVIREINTDEAREFLSFNHLQGFFPSKVYLGLYYENNLVSISTFGRARYKREYEWELLRFCNKIGYHVVGASSKLFKAFIKKYSPKSVVSYSDKRFSNGNMYQKLGFSFLKTSKPNYFYWDKKKSRLKLESRIKFQKRNLHKILFSYDPSLSETKNMFANGYWRVWDCGNDVWLWQA